MNANVPKPKKARRLTPQQERFAGEYLMDLNATAAARRAGYSEKSCESLGYQLLQNPLVRVEIDRRMQQRNVTLMNDADSVLERLKAELDADLVDLFDQNGGIKDVKEWPLAWRRGLVNQIVVTESYGETANGERIKTGRVTKIKISDRVKRLELFGRHGKVGAFRENITLEVESPLQQLLRDISGDAIRPMR